MWLSLFLAAMPVAAHGLGGRIDLPIPVWQFAWAASLVVVVSFGMLGWFWRSAHLDGASVGAPLPRPVQTTGRRLLPLTRMAGLAAFGVLLYASLSGTNEVNSNIAPFAFFIILWVGFQMVSAALGDAWASLNPFLTLAALGGWIRSRVSTESAAAPDMGSGGGSWAVATILAFLWLELAFHQGGTPRSIGIYLIAYTVAMLAGGVVSGRGWMRNADGFGVLFTTIATMAPLHLDRSGTLRLRYPVAGLARLELDPERVRLILAVLGATTFDGFSRSSLWLDVISNRSGWELTAVNTGGLIFGIGFVMALYRLAIAAMGRITGQAESELGDAFAPSLVPIVVAYTVAHYFTFLVIEGQNAIRLASDPFGLGWDIFGTAGYQVNYMPVSTTAIAWIQTVAIVVGHVLAVLVAHDRAVKRYPAKLAVRSQYPMLAAMLAFTVTGLLLLLG